MRIFKLFRFLQFFVTIIFIVFSFPEEAYSHCIHTKLGALDIIKAPLIFSGKAVEYIDRKEQQTDGRYSITSYTRFEVTRIFKGPNLKTIDIRTGNSITSSGNNVENCLSNFTIGHEAILMPSVTEGGEYIVPLLQDREKLDNAYDTPFPTIYLLADYAGEQIKKMSPTDKVYAYHLALIILVFFFASVLCILVVKRRTKNHLQKDKQ